MNRLLPARIQPTLLLTALMGGMFLTSCASAPSSTSAPGAPQEQVMSAPAAADRAANMAEPAGGASQKVAAESQASSPVAQPSAAQPQLVKTAQVTLTVDSVKLSLDKISAIARQNQGDVLGLQDQTPLDASIRHTAFMQLRVPQAKLETTLGALASVGTVQQQSITAEDVSNQLIDNQARLRNLRNTEEMLLKIMNRSGSVGDVLKVAQELSNVRSSIEQIDAQLTDLKNRVAYSIVTVNVEEAIASSPPQPAVATEMEDAWEQATHSMREFTVSLLKLGIWLVAYTPYWAALLVGALLLHRLRRSPAPTPPETLDPPAANPSN